MVNRERDPIHIDVFRTEHAAAFDRLNRAWLVDHGQIFVALRDGDVLGTCAVIPSEPGVFELAKLAVAPTARGQGLGRRLVEACVSLARLRGMHRMGVSGVTEHAGA